MKINFGHKEEDENKEYDFIYSNYKPVQTTSFYRKDKGPSFKWLFQLLISGAILVLLVGLFRLDVPYTGKLKNGVSYLLTSETDVEPMFYSVIRLASQIGNLEWPVMDNPLGPVQPAITEEPAVETLVPLPVSGNVIKEYGWIENPDEPVKLFHQGIDIAVPNGTPVKASAAGIVVKTGEAPGLGHYVLVQNHNGELMRYANLGEVTAKEQKAVKAGDLLGKTGNAEAGEPHLHFEVIIDGQPVDPFAKLGKKWSPLTDELVSEEK